MLPATLIAPDTVMELVFATSQVGPQAPRDPIKEFSDISDRTARAGLNLALELNLVSNKTKERTSYYSVTDSYQEIITEVGRDQRGTILNRALIQYRPFRAFVRYVEKGYSIDAAARQANVVHEAAPGDDTLKKFIKRFGEYSEAVDTSGDSIKVTIQNRDIPVDSTDSIEELREAIHSEAEIRFYLERTLGPELVDELDPETEDDLVKAFYEHASDPRDSLTAAHRALEDYFQDIANEHGSSEQDYEKADSAAGLARRLQGDGDGIIREIHRMRAEHVAGLRSRGGAHGKDKFEHERWRADERVALQSALETTLLIRSVGNYLDGDPLTL